MPRAVNPNYELLNFTLVHIPDHEKYKFQAMCNLCNKMLTNTSKKRLTGHRNICPGNDIKMENKPSQIIVQQEISENYNDVKDNISLEQESVESVVIPQQQQQQQQQQHQQIESVVLSTHQIENVQSVVVPTSTPPSLSTSSSPIKRRCLEQNNTDESSPQRIVLSMDQLHDKDYMEDLLRKRQKEDELHEQKMEHARRIHELACEKLRLEMLFMQKKHEMEMQLMSKQL